jgi:hypothetical protein
MVFDKDCLTDCIHYHGLAPLVSRWNAGKSQHHDVFFCQHTRIEFFFTGDINYNFFRNMVVDEITTLPQFPKDSALQTKVKQIKISLLYRFFFHRLLTDIFLYNSFSISLNCGDSPALALLCGVPQQINCTIVLLKRFVIIGLFLFFFTPPFYF